MFTPQVTAFTAIGDVLSLGSTVLTDLAWSFEQFQPDPAAFLFPSQTIQDHTIVIEQVFKGLGMAVLVAPGMPDKMTDASRVKSRRVQGAFTRESDALSMHVLNNLRQVGTLNEKNGLKQIAENMQRLVERNNRLFAVWRTQALLGGINYTDSWSGQTINVNMQIPAGNLRSVLDLSDYTTRTWDKLATAKVIQDVKNFKQKMMQTSKAEPTHLVMRSDLRAIIGLHTDVINRTEGQGAGPITQFIKMTNGEISHICGMEIVIADTDYEDPSDREDKTATKVWPINKVGFVVAKHPMQPSAVFGKTVYCVGEDPMGRAGLWSYANGDHKPPAAPGVTLQVGNAGIPYIVYPEWAGLLTVGDADALQAVLDDGI